MIWKGPSQINYPNIFPTIDILNNVLGMKTAVLFTTKDVFLMGVTVPLMVILSLFIRNTKMGKAMRATAQDREAAALMGINVETVIRNTFFIGGALAGAAGMMVGIYLNTGRYLMGFDAGLLAFTSGLGRHWQYQWRGVGRLRHRFSQRRQRSVPLLGMDACPCLYDTDPGAGLQTIRAPGRADTGEILSGGVLWLKSGIH